MSELYYVGTVKIEGASIFDLTQSPVLVKSEAGYLCPGQVVEFRIGQIKKIGKVICTSLISKGSDDEAEITANATVYEAEKIYHLSWEKKKEEEKDGN